MSVRDLLKREPESRLSSGGHFNHLQSTAVFKRASRDFVPESADHSAPGQGRHRTND